MPDRWWAGDPAERYWLEATDRADIGSDLRAPDTDAGGRDNWRYSLFREAIVGDIVLHYDKGRAAAIVGWSRISGAPFAHPTVWAARGSYARGRNARPEEVPGYRIPLTDFTRLPTPLPLARLREERAVLEAIVDRLRVGGRTSLYFPFDTRSVRDLRLLQGYAFKLPATFVRSFPELVSVPLFDGPDQAESDLMVSLRAAYGNELGGIIEASEGRAILVTHLDRERSSSLAREKKERALRDTGALACEACGFDFAARYGDRGIGFIECHHTRPVSELDDGGRTRLEDLALVCANCHRMIHARRPWMSVEELRAGLVARDTEAGPPP